MSSLPICQAGVPTPQEVKAGIVRMYLDGAFRREITAKFGCGKSTISAVLAEFKVPSRGERATAICEERVEAVTTLFTSGKSFREIAQELGMTKNAVAGIVHRKGIARSTDLNIAAKKKSGNGSPAAQAKFAARRAERGETAEPRAPRERKTAKVVPIRPAEVPQFAGPSKLLGDLVNGECRWPVNDPGPGRMDETHFCAAPDAPLLGEGTPYCAHHRRRAISHSQPRKPATEPRQRAWRCA